MKRFSYAVATLAVVLCLCTACQKECVHEYRSEITQAASCIRTGVETFTCALCQDSYTQPVPFLNHTYDAVTVEKEASCSAEGLLKYTCTSCNGSRYEQIKKSPHTLGEAAVTKEPNCSEEGERTGSCAICGAENVVEKIPVNDVHTFENTVVREATCTDLGEGLDTCTLCGHTQTCQYSYKAHTFGQPETVTAATCTKDGKAKVTCSACGATEDRKISAAGHKWTGGTCTQPSTCSACGTAGSKADHDYEITRQTNTDPKYYAKQVDKQCKTCGVQKTLYYVNDIEVDIEVIQKTLDDYAKAYGFVHIVHSVDNLDSDQKSSKTLEVFKFDWYKDPVEELIRQGKLLIDSKYNSIKNSTFPMDQTLLHLKAGYWSSGSLGTGMFQVYIGLTTLPAEG